MKRDKFRCTYCGAPGTDVELEVDHIIPVAKGGSHHMSNLTTACRMCNQCKGVGAAPKTRAEVVPQMVAGGIDTLLQASCVMLHYHRRHRVLEIHLEDGDCVDMGGAVKLAEAIDPEIVHIRTFSGSERDTWYRRYGDKWQAYEPPRAVG
jgi:5-methylcytosine-specific restriction protein A